FRYKPQDPSTRPGIYAPYQPRFDWNLWFASLGPWRDYPIVPSTEVRLFGNIGSQPCPRNGHKVFGGAVNSWDFMHRRSSANPMALSVASSGLRLVHTNDSW